MLLSDFPIIELECIDSTNNYAMQLIDANKAQHGLTIVAQSQLMGKGQRGKVWVDEPGQSLLMSIIVTPNVDISEQFAFNASVAVSIANVLQKECPDTIVKIKWPNDIIINDKKAGGILIENILRGSRWTHCVIGIGINVLQVVLSPELVNGTSIKMSSGKTLEVAQLRNELVSEILSVKWNTLSGEQKLTLYNNLLYKKDMQQLFRDGDQIVATTILSVNLDGRLSVLIDKNTIEHLYHGQMEWVWQ